jgi:hypothetical protein
MSRESQFALARCLSTQYSRIGLWLQQNPNGGTVRPAGAMQDLQRVQTARECLALADSAAFLDYDSPSASCKNGLCDPPGTETGTTHQSGEYTG